MGLWSEVLNSNNYKYKPALFIDRDGTFIEDKGYLSKTDKVKLIQKSCDLIKKCNENSIPVIVVTNQSGIGRGYYTWQDFYNVELYIREKLKQNDIFIDMVCACAFHAEGLKKYKIDKNSWRKPSAGMLLEAKNKLNIDLSKSWIIGDKITDINAGFNAGLKGAVLVNNQLNDLKKIDNFKVINQQDLEKIDWLIDILKT